jgi:hypothetical protein
MKEDLMPLTNHYFHTRISNSEALAVIGKYKKSMSSLKLFLPQILVQENPDKRAE